MLSPPNTRNSNSQSPVVPVDDYCRQNNITTITDEIQLKIYTGRYINKLFGNVVVSFNTTINDSFVTLTPYSGCVVKLSIRFGERFQGILLPTNEPHMFHMKPTGIFEFSAHAKSNRNDNDKNKLSTMPVEFLDFDSRGIPYSFKTVWQKEEIIQFGRGVPLVNECFNSIRSNAVSLLDQNLFLILIIYICINFLICK